MSGAVLLRATRDIPTLSVEAFVEGVRAQVEVGARPVTLYGRRGDGDDDVVLTCVLLTPPLGASRAELQVLRATADRRRGYPALSRDLPRFHALEREVWEQTGLTPRDHPWLKPLRSQGGERGSMDAYPYFKVEGKEVHEVAVGPVHAGVIEPGSFRFMCHGELVLHLEVQLGYQHRGVEALLLRRPPRLLAPLVESVAGDSAVAYATAYSRAVEALAGHASSPEVDLVRGVALELERIAMHLAGLAGITQDVAFLPGSSTYGRLRTGVINASQRLCGNRFGRGWIRPGGARAGLERALFTQVKDVLDALAQDKAGVDALLFGARTVAHRLKTTGIVSRKVADEVGLLGPSARASGAPLDLRAQLPDPAFARVPLPITVEEGGDCWARTRVRAREVDASRAWILAAVEAQGGGVACGVEPVGPLAPDTLCVALVEGWRGEVLVALETDAAGGLRHAKLQDPSLQNWLGLAMAVRENGISDFPICNKSFDLSYCGHDL